MSLSVKLTYTRPQIVKNAVEVGSRNRFTTEAGKIVNAGKSIVTENANTCTMIALNAGNSDCLLHLAPEQQAINDIKPGLQRCINKLLQQCKNFKESVTGLIIGGRELIKDNPESVASFNVYNTAATALDELDIPFTMICGKNLDIPNDNICAKDNIAVIWNKVISNLRTATPERQKNLEKELLKYYQFVEIDEEVPVELIS